MGSSTQQSQSSNALEKRVYNRLSVQFDRELTSMKDLALAVQKGLTIGDLQNFEKAIDSDPLDWIVQQDTAKRFEGNEPTLSLDEGAKLLRLAKLFFSAEEVFGDRVQAQNWLMAKNSSLNEESPITMAKNEFGAALAEQQLHQLNDQ